MKAKTYHQLKDKLEKKGFGRIFEGITELCRTELLNTPRKTEYAQETIMTWWKGLHIKPSLKEYRSSYILLSQLRKEVE